MIEEDFGAFVGGGSGGEDVVDEDDGFVFNEGGGASFDGESIFEVFESFGSAEACLCLGVAGSAEGVMSWNAGSCREVLGNLLGLVELPLSLSFPEQGHGDEESGCLIGGESDVGQC